MILSTTPAKRCLTVVAWTIQDGKTLLVKHKKLGIWLAPGGHVEEDELPQHAAEREFFEETGVKVRVISPKNLPIGTTSEYLPPPFAMNLHWINKPSKTRGFCEQHYTLNFFVEVLDTSAFARQEEETDDIGWFTLEQVNALDTTDDIKQEAAYAFAHYQV
jgi:8-oxo-dGTP diphosphatase